MSASDYNAEMTHQLEALIVFGDLVHATRGRLRWSQRELSRRSGVAQSRISLLERHRLRDVGLGEIEAICRALGIAYRVDFRSPDVITRPADLLHTRCSGHVDRRLRGAEWSVAREVEVGTGRIRGWIDLLAFDDRTRTLVVMEIKTQLVDLGGIERTLGWYERAAWAAARNLGWQPRRVGVALLVLHTSANVATIRSNSQAIRAAFPRTAAELAAVLGRESGSDGRFLAMIDPGSTGRRWLRPSPLEPGRLRPPYVDYIDAVRKLEPWRST